jgi:hypothetical protein
MTFDINAKSAQLLERLANSIYDRDQNNLMKQHFSFNISEIHIVEKWLVDTLAEYRKIMAEY